MIPPNANNCLDSGSWLEKGSQEEYGCHLAQFTNNLKEKKCVYCDQRKPALLEELAFSVILENEELFKSLNSALYHLPQRICWLIGRAVNANLLSQVCQLVEFVWEYGETQSSWFDVDHNKSKFLSRFRLYCEVYQKLERYLTIESAGIDEILHYLSNFDNTYQDFWSRMTCAITNLKAETDSEDFETLRSKICPEENNVILVETTELRQLQLSGFEYESMKELQRLSKTFPCPVVFKPTTIEVENLKSHKIPHLLNDVDPEVIFEVDLRKTAWSVADVDQLAGVLSTCDNLSVIKLQQISTIDQVLEDVTPAISRLLSHHQHLENIGLTGFNLAGTLSRYPLPPVENLQLFLCSFKEEDFNFMSNRSDLALKSLVVFPHLNDDHFPSLCTFIQNQAKSLTSVLLEYPRMSPTEICHLLRIMAKFNKLQTLALFCMEEISYITIGKIIVDVMSIHSTRSFFIDNTIASDRSENEAEINHLNDVVKEMCKINRRPPIYLGVNTFLPP